MNKNKYIRNFSIIAHIDHGKSTLSDRIIEICNKKKLKANEQRILDNMELEKEKGITIKAQCVNLKYIYKNKKYFLNLIDTPGHIDFTYEVTKSLSICEGVVLLIDIQKGIQAQTLHNYNIAKKLNLKILIVINKIDLNKKNILNIKKDINDILKIKKNIYTCSAKTGEGIKNIIINIIKKIPFPKCNIKKPFLAIIIDSFFNSYKGIFLLIKIKNGYIKINDKLKIINNSNIYFYVKEIITNTPHPKKITKLNCGNIAWIICNIKNININFVGLQIIKFNNNKIYNLKNIKSNIIKPQIFANIFSKYNINYSILKKSIQKLSLNDSSFTYESIKSPILGYGFKCGFLGILHIEIIKERLKREYNTKIIVTNPSVIFKINTLKKKLTYISNINKILNIYNIKTIQEPWIICTIKTNNLYIGKIINLCNENRGKYKNIIYNNNKISIIYKLPLLEIIYNFSNKLKSITNGYSDFNYKFYKYKYSNIKILQVNINNNIIHGLSQFVHIKNIKKTSHFILNILKNNIKKQLFDITIQILCNNKIINKIVIKALRKNVIKKCYGGDITRKKKLLQKQKLGKKKMKKIGNIYIPVKIFTKVFKQ